MHTYDFHIGDYARDTAHLSLLEHGVYRLLLDRLYSDEAPLPLDVTKLTRKLGAKTTTEQNAVATVLDEFFHQTPEGYTHKRVIQELSEARLRALKSKYSQVMRWWRHNKWPNEPTLDTYIANPEAYHDPHTGHIRQPATASTETNGSNTTVYDRTTNGGKRNSYQPPTANRQLPTAKEIKTPLIPQGGEIDSLELQHDESEATASPEKKKGGRAALAEQIYSLYPRKVGKVPALRAIERVLKAGKVPPEDLIVTVRNYARATATWPAGDEVFIPHPATWFNSGRYDDDPREWLRGQPTDTPTPATYLPSTYDGPEGWRHIMTDLYGGDDWQSAYPNWQATTPGDREKIKARLLQNTPAQ